LWRRSSFAESGVMNVKCHGHNRTLVRLSDDPVEEKEHNANRLKQSGAQRDVEIIDRRCGLIYARNMIAEIWMRTMMLRNQVKMR
jgi:hypothetical protein